MRCRSIVRLPRSPAPVAGPRGQTEMLFWHGAGYQERLHKVAQSESIGPFVAHKRKPADRDAIGRPVESPRYPVLEKCRPDRLPQLSPVRPDCLSLLTLVSTALFQNIRFFRRIIKLNHLLTLTERACAQRPTGCEWRRLLHLVCPFPLAQDMHPNRYRSRKTGRVSVFGTVS